MTKTIGADAALAALKGWSKGEGERETIVKTYRNYEIAVQPPDRTREGFAT